jgi:hypothetical protein
MSSLRSRARAQATEAAEAFSKLEGEIREVVSRGTTAPRLQQGKDNELAASNIGSLLQHVSGTSVQEIEKLIAEGGCARATWDRGIRSPDTKRQAIDKHDFGKP